MDISSMLEVEMKEVLTVNSKENVTPRTECRTFAPAAAIPVSPEELNYYKQMFKNDIASVRFYKLHCTSCNVHIGSAPSQANNMREHPILRVLLCENCREFYGDGTFEQGDDATDMFCRWCANGGNLYCCSYCSNTFCSKCIRRNLDPIIIKKIEADEKWKCFVCDPTDLYKARATCWALLRHVKTVKRILQNDANMSLSEIHDKMNKDEALCCIKKRKRKSHSTENDSDDSKAITYTQRKQQKLQNYQKRRKTHFKGNSDVSDPKFVPIRPYLPHPLLACELSLVECDNAIVNSDGSISTAVNPNLSTTSKSNVTTLAYNSVNNLPTITLSQDSSSRGSFQKIMLSTPSSAQNKTVNAPMVTIPSQNDNLLTRGRVILPQRQKNHPSMIVTPNIIDLDSDSDEPTTEVQKQISNMVVIDNQDTVDTSTSGVVPVALVSSENNSIPFNFKQQPLRELSASVESSKTFSDTVTSEMDHIDVILRNLKKNVKTYGQDPKNKISASQSPNMEYQKAKSVCNTIKRTVDELLKINCRVIREYYSHERITGNSSNQSQSVIPESCKNLPLDMECVHDSESESESELTECIFVNPSSKILQDEFLGSNKKNTVDCATDCSIKLHDKAVQVYDVNIVRRDYEKCIGYSQLTIPNCTLETDRYEESADKNEHIGDYEEQFINFLQRIEEEGIETDEMKGCYDSDVEMSRSDDNCLKKDKIEINMSAMDSLSSKIHEENNDKFGHSDKSLESTTSNSKEYEISNLKNKIFVCKNQNEKGKYLQSVIMIEDDCTIIE